MIKKIILMSALILFTQQTWCALEAALYYVEQKRRSLWSAMSESEMIEYVNRSDFRIDRRDYEGISLLARAAQKNYIVAMELLISKGAVVNSSEECSALHKAAQFFSLEAIGLLLRHGVNINLKNHYNETALYEAAGSQICGLSDDARRLFEKKRIVVIDLLLRHGADPNSKSHYFLYRPTVLFKPYMNPVIARMLLKHGADISIKNAAERMATQEACSDCVKELFQNWEEFQTRPSKTQDNTDNTLFDITLVYAQQNFFFDDSKLQNCRKLQECIGRRKIEKDRLIKEQEQRKREQDWQEFEQLHPMSEQELALMPTEADFDAVERIMGEKFILPELEKSK